MFIRTRQTLLKTLLRQPACGVWQPSLAGFWLYLLHPGSCIHPPTHPSVHPPTHLAIHPPIGPFNDPSICRFIYNPSSTHPSTCTSCSSITLRAVMHTAFVLLPRSSFAAKRLMYIAGSTIGTAVCRLRYLISFWKV